jgi:hypothetical protein
VWEAVVRAASRNAHTALVLRGTDAWLGALLRERPDVARCFSLYLRFPPYTAEELTELIRRRLNARGHEIDEDTRAALVARLTPQPPADGARAAHRIADRMAERATPGPATPGPAAQAPAGPAPTTARNTAAQGQAALAHEQTTPSVSAGNNEPAASMAGGAAGHY